MGGQERLTGYDADPKAVVLAYLEALNRASADDAAALVSEDFINEHVSSLGQSSNGRAEYRRRLDGFLARFAALRYEIEQVITEDHLVAVAYRLSATLTDHGPNATPPRPFNVRGMFRFEVAAGRIVRRVDYWDSGDFLRQVQGP